MAVASGPVSPFLTTRQAAAYLRLQPCTLESWRSEGEGPVFHKLGGRAYYKLADLDSWIESRRRKSTAEHHVRHTKPSGAETKGPDSRDQ